ncbi:MAG TPA: peptidoglycan recognition family protein [Methylomirabilota bacterium]|nr:peptidoglycan recognition family protein [Methylomirabilota bacterium]
MRQRPQFVIAVVLVAAFLAGCATNPGTVLHRKGDEIVVAGQFIHTGTRVVLWMDQGGYDAYRVERRFAPFDRSSWETSRVAVAELKTPNRYGLRQHVLTPEQIEQVRGGGWDLPLLQQVVDQFVIHFDASGTSRQCFKTLHDVRDLSVHFMLDLDGTIYQTLDVKERAWHATSSNTRSVGIEIASPGAFPTNNARPLDQWYARDDQGRTRITLPKSLGDGGIRTKNFIGRPARNEPIVGHIHGQQIKQYDFTPEQYRALIQLTAALCKVLPKIRCDYPRDASGRLVREKLPDDELNSYEGLLGHYHVQKNKVDPGPAFQWDFVIEGARRLMASPESKGGARALQPQER